MFIFTKMTQIPVKISNKNPRLASYILSQYGGPDGELGASLRYLSQRFAQTEKCGIALLTDIGTEELGHLEMIGSIVTQLTKGEGAKSFDRYGVGRHVRARRFQRGIRAESPRNLRQYPPYVR